MGSAVIYRQEIIQDITLFTSEPKARFYSDLFAHLDLSGFPDNISAWNNGKKNKGYTKYVTLPDDYRLSIDRDCISFKKIYSLRTEIERYNSRFKQTGQERLWIRGINAARNLNTIAHISLLTAAYAAIVTHSSCSSRSLKSVKRIA